MSPIVRSTSPQDPSAGLGQSDDGGSRALKAVDRAGRALRDWSWASAVERGRALDGAVDRLSGHAEATARLMTRETGKPIVEARPELARGVAILGCHAQATLDPGGETFPAAHGRSILLARCWRCGIVGLLTPWNCPVATPPWRLAPAPTGGNAGGRQ